MKLVYWKPYVVVAFTVWFLNPSSFRLETLGYDLDIIILCALHVAKAHKKSLFERQIPVIPLRNCESKNLGFKGETSSIGVIIEFPDKNRPHLVLATATGATARKEFIYDVILLEYLATGCYRCYSSQGVRLWRHSFRVPCYWLLQVLQLARSLSMTSFF